MSILEIMNLYDIKQPTAYKWKKALTNLGLDYTEENFNKIRDGEIILSQALSQTSIVTVESSVEEPIEIAETSTMSPAVDSGFGLSIGRLQELNSEAELEVLVKSKLKDYHESQLQSRRSQELKSKISEVKNVDPKELGKMLSLLGVG